MRLMQENLFSEIILKGSTSYDLKLNFKISFNKEKLKNNNYSNKLMSI
jgi:hypothetical protein